MSASTSDADISVLIDNVVCNDFNSVMIYSITYIIIKGYLSDVSFRQEAFCNSLIICIDSIKILLLCYEVCYTKIDLVFVFFKKQILVACPTCRSGGQLSPD